MDPDILHNIHRKDILARSTDQFIGILKGIISDDAVMASEVAFLAEWLKINKEIADEWPMNEVQIAITIAMQDGELCADDLEDIKDLIHRIAPPLR